MDPGWGFRTHVIGAWGEGEVFLEMRLLKEREINLKN